MVFGFGVNAWICLRAGEGPLGSLFPFMRSSADGVECRWELAVAPAHLVLSVYWTLKTASAYLAGRLGMSFTQLFDSHAMWNIVHAFDFVTGVCWVYCCVVGGCCWLPTVCCVLVGATARAAHEYTLFHRCTLFH